MENYQLMLDKIISEIPSGTRPRLLLHACCAPCSSYTIEYLSAYFDITLYFYNPNISPESEYLYRADELRRLVREMSLSDKVDIVQGEYEIEKFAEISRGRESLPEGGARCRDCYRLRLRGAAEYAAANKFDYFTTTLSISPHKRADWLNEIGEELSEVYGVKYLFSDFKKRNGYKRSCELSERHHLYRQPFCGCAYSRAEADRRKAKADHI